MIWLQELTGASAQGHAAPGHARLQWSHSTRPAIPGRSVPRALTPRWYYDPSGAATAGQSSMAGGGPPPPQPSHEALRSQPTSASPPLIIPEPLYGSGVTRSYPNNDSTKVSASKGWRSSSGSPTRTNLTGRFMTLRTPTRTSP